MVESLLIVLNFSIYPEHTTLKYFCSTGTSKLVTVDGNLFKDTKPLRLVWRNFLLKDNVPKYTARQRNGYSCV